MPATMIAAVTASKKKAGRKDVETIFKIIVFAFDERCFQSIL